MRNVTVEKWCCPTHCHDMRLPGKFVVRVSKEPGHEVTDPMAAMTKTPPSPAGTDAI